MFLYILLLPILFVFLQFVTTSGVKRPISPDLAVWKFSPAGYLHVGVRITGCVLAGVFTVAGLMNYLPLEVPYILDVGKTHAPFLVPCAKALIVFPLAYHYAGGVRQLFQDMTARGYSHKFHNTSSYVMLAFALAATGALTFCTIEPPKKQ